MSARGGQLLDADEQRHVAELGRIWMEWGNGPAYVTAVGMMVGASWARFVAHHEATVDQREIFRVFRESFHEGFRLQMKEQAS